MTAKYTIQATTAAEFQVAVVKWLKDHAIAHSSQARISTLKRTKTRLEAQAIAINYAASFIEEIVIEQPKPSYAEADNSKSVEDWLKEDRFIMAIRRHRMDTDCSLLEAKNYCEALRSRLTKTEG